MKAKKPKTPKAKKPKVDPFEAYKAKCLKIGKRILPFPCDDLIDENDPYGLFEKMRIAFDGNIDPDTMLRCVFEEDFARAEYDEDLLAQSLAEECGEED